MRSRSRILPPLICAVLGLAGCATPATQASRPPGERSEPVVRVYWSVHGTQLHAFIFQPPGEIRSPVPALLFFHPGGWVSGSTDWMFATARRFARLGIVTLAIDYRLSGSAVTPIESLDDTCAAFQWVRRSSRELGIDPQRVGGYGVSAGGHLITAAATIGCGNQDGSQANGGPDALLLWSPVLDVSQSDWFHQLLQGRGSPEAYSPAQHVPPHPVPVSIVQGELDTLATLPDARRFCDQVKANGGHCELNVYPGVGHLLTRNLQEQETNSPDTDPATREDALARQERFLCELWSPACKGGSASQGSSRNRNVSAGPGMVRRSGSRAERQEVG
jgi:acetyl esterase